MPHGTKRQYLKEEIFLSKETMQGCKSTTIYTETLQPGPPEDQGLVWYINYQF